MIAYEADFVDRLNRTYEGGKFIKAVVVTESVSPLVKKYWVDHEVALSFEGNTYEPLHMIWNDIKTSQSMPTEGAEVDLSNIGGYVTKYVKEFDITGNDVVLQLIHLDLLTTLTNYWRRKFKILAIRFDSRAASITVGRNLGRNKLPRRVLLADEFPGISNDIPRIL